MNRDQSIELWQKGKDAWNKWAKEMLSERRRLEGMGGWNAEKDLNGCLEGKNPGTKKWLADARADFSALWFRRSGFPVRERTDPEKANQLRVVMLETDCTDFSNLIFPSEAIFDKTHFGCGDTFFDSTTFNGKASFRSTTFSDNASFNSATFSGDVRFNPATFNGGASFYSTIFKASASFNSATFSSNASFNSATFSGDVPFVSATFHGYATFVSTIFSGFSVFDSATFSGITSFRKTTFSGGLSFYSTTFSGDADFRSTTLSDNASFNSATFSGDVRFVSATFHGYATFISTTFNKVANFNLAEFEKPASFNRSEFCDKAIFTSIISKRSFSLTDTFFHQVPDFGEADFHTPPVLDDITIVEPLQKRTWRWHDPKGKQDDIRPAEYCEWKVAFAADETRKYRALGKMADEARDYLNEMEFFARQQLCNRFWNDRPGGRNAGRFWFTVFYHFFSDFGRSFARPAISWIATTIAFAVYYALAAKDSWHWWQNLSDPFYLSFRHGLIISGLARNDYLKHVLDSMYYPGNLPGFAMIAQSTISAIWLFLLLLALRNQFKIR